MLKGTLSPVSIMKGGLDWWTSQEGMWEWSLPFHMTLNKSPDCLHPANQGATVCQASHSVPGEEVSKRTRVIAYVPQEMGAGGGPWGTSIAPVRAPQNEPPA